MFVANDVKQYVYNMLDSGVDKQADLKQILQLFIYFVTVCRFRSHCKNELLKRTFTDYSTKS